MSSQISSYHNPPSDSPSSVSSPQNRAGAMYAPTAPQQQHMYYGGYAPHHQQSYYHPQTMQHSQISYHSPQNQMSAYHQPPLQLPPPVTAAHSPPTDGNIKLSSMHPPRSRSHLSNAPLGISPPLGSGHNFPSPHQNNSSTTQSAAPGPIRATTPLVVRQDGSGVQWIKFEYSRDRIKVEYEIRCDVEAVDIKNLPQEHKDANCVYPRACNKDTYRGNRFTYESECNEVGWALSYLNPSLKGKRGLIQRAVDSWRNSNKDKKLRSRRVRRLAKNEKRAQQEQQRNQAKTHTGTDALSQTLNSDRDLMRPSAGVAVPQYHHHVHTDGSARGGVTDITGNHTSRQTYKSPTNSASPVSTRYSQNWIPSYAGTQSNHATTLPPTPNSLDQYGPVGPSNAAMVASSPSVHQHEQGTDFFQEFPIVRKTITLHDFQKNTHPRVNFKPEDAPLSDIPDTFRKTSSVFPRSHYARQVTPSPFDDFDDDENTVSTIPPTTNVQLCAEDGWEGEFSIPRMAKSRRDREKLYNDIGSRLTWSTSKQHLFNGRPQFLQQALNTIRVETGRRLEKSGREIPSIIATRPGKRKWHETMDHANEDQPQVA